MAKAEVTVVLTLDDSTTVKEVTLIENIAEIGDIVLETEILKLGSPPPIVRPTNPRVQ